MLVRPASGKKMLWQELLRHELLTALEQQPVVIVPVGSVEQHGPHCPQDVDISIPYHLAIETADAIDDFPVIVAPPVTYGFTHYNMGEVGTISLALETFIAVLCDVSRSIWANGFHRLILLNGHGGNEQPTWSAAVKLAEEDVWPVALTYWNMAPDELLAWSESDEGSIGHGGEWETSLQLHLRPQLVDPSRAVKDDWRLKFGPEVGRYAHFPERRREMAHGVMGDPFVASAEKGERLFRVLVDRLVALCHEYHAVDPRNTVSLAATVREHGVASARIGVDSCSLPRGTRPCTWGGSAHLADRVKSVSHLLASSSIPEEANKSAVTPP